MGMACGKRSGQAAVLIALSMFSLVIFLAFATNMGILVNDKIRIQNAADMGAYSAAYREAQVLNRLTLINKEILNEAKRCRQVLESRIWQGVPCACQAIAPDGDALIDGCESRIRSLGQQFVAEAEYTASVGSALQAGRAAMNANVPDLADTTGSHFFETSPASPTSQGSGVTQSQATITSFVQLQSQFDYFVQPSCACMAGCCFQPQVPRITPISFGTYFMKPDAEPDVWVMSEASGAMKSSYLDIAYNPNGADGGYFGGSSSGSDDVMTAVSIAKPFDGSVGPTFAYTSYDGSSRLDGFAAGNLAGSPIQYSAQFEIPENFMQPTYRARLAGLHEWDGVSSDYNPSAALASNPVGRTRDPSRIHH
jgi:hypothetical protein